MNLNHDTRYMTRTGWLRTLVVSLATAAVVTWMFIAAGQIDSAATAVARILVYGTTMGAVAGLILPVAVHRFRGLSAPVRWGLMFPLLLVLGIIGGGLGSALLSLLHLQPWGAFWPSFVSTLGVHPLVMLAVGVGMLLYESQRHRLDATTAELRERELEHERARKMAVESRLSSLESRLQPHFLFNTLNSVLALIRDDPEKAERTVERLSDLLRAALDGAERGMCPLDHELKIAVDYLEIERTRLGERLSYAFDVTPDVAACEVPSLTVQTLVENSVKHGIAPRRRGGRIRVEAALQGSHLVLSVWDDGPGFTAAMIRPGHGLDNLRARLLARFGSAATLDVTRRDGGPLVTVSLPRTPAAAAAHT